MLDGVDLRIEPGEFVAVVGRSGCGKSALLRLLAGLEEASTGAVQLDAGPARGEAGFAALEERVLRRGLEGPGPAG